MVDAIIEKNAEEIERKITEAILEDPIEALSALAKYVPKDITMGVEFDGSMSIGVNTNLIEASALKAVQQVRYAIDAGEYSAGDSGLREPAALDAPGGT